MKGKLMLVFVVINFSFVKTYHPQAGYGYKPQEPVFYRNYNRLKSVELLTSEEKHNSSSQRRKYYDSSQIFQHREPRYFDERLPYRNPENAVYNNYRKQSYAQNLKQNKKIINKKYYQEEAISTTIEPAENNKEIIENSKFLGTSLEKREIDRTLTNQKFLSLQKKLGLFGGSGCLFKSNDQGKEEGRFLWDLNVYNYYLGQKRLCNTGGILGDELTSVAADPLQPYYGPKPLFQNFWSLFLPGGALNPVGGNRPIVGAPESSIYNSPPVALSQVPTYYQPGIPSTYNEGTAAAIPVNNLTPGQIVGGVASTVNSIIQQLSGNIPRPVRNLLDF